VYIHGMARLTALDLEMCAAMRATCACNHLRSAARAMTQRYERAIAPSGLKATQLPILVALGAGGAIPITPLADALALERTTLTRNLHVLEQRGLVTVLGDPTDARVRLATLTDAGAGVLSDALVRWRDAQDALTAEFGASRLDALIAELADIATTAAG
jgi:DNA-binding MarR family transcriptional regulator